MLTLRRLTGAFFLYGSAAMAAEEVVRALDFTAQPDGNATHWLKQQGYEFKLQSTALNPRFQDGALWLSTRREEAGLLALTFPEGKALPGVKRVRITWGVEKFPEGADWEHGVNRTALAAMISFGHERLPSGLPFGALAAPAFICPFLAAKEPAGKAYVGKLWKLGGRYISVKSGKPGEAVVSEVEIDHRFRALFKKDSTPPVTGIGIQMNTKDTQGEAAAFLKKIEFLRGQ
jgi:hypothetical protein